MYIKTYYTSRVALRAVQKSTKGFTLAEALIAVVLIGLGAVAILVAAGSGTRVNEGATDLTTASFLAQELREWTLQLPIDDANSTNDITAMDGATYSPPRDGGGNAISDMSGWSQEVIVTWRNASDLDSVVTDGSSYVVYVEVTVKQNSQEILNTGWLITERS